MNIQSDRLIKLISITLVFIFVGCDDNSQEACPEAEQGKYTSIRKKGELPASYINDLKPSYGLPDDFNVSYDIIIYAVEYETTDPKGNSVIASGAIYIPVKTDNEPLSLISGQHGLTIKRSDVASVLPLYGYLGACEREIDLNDNLFLIGYSNGGYNSMAMHHELAMNPRKFDIDASVVIAGYFDLEREANFTYPERLGRPSWAVYHPYVLNKTYELNIIDKIVQQPYADRLDDLFNGEIDAYFIDNQLTDFTQQLFTKEYLDDYNSLSIFDTYRDIIKSNSLIETTISGDLLLIHSKEDEVVPYSQSEKLYNSILSKGGNAELVLLETGKHSPQDYAPAVVNALGWLKQYE